VNAANRAVIIAVMTLLLGGCRVGVSADLTNANREFAAGHFEQALAHYQQAERSRPQEPTAVFGAGTSFYRLQRYDEAAAAFESAAAGLADSRDRARALHNLGNSLVNVERFEEALDAYRQALRLDDRESTRLNYLLIRNRLSGSSNGRQGQSGAANLPDDQGLFEVARQFDAPARRHETHSATAPRDSDW
jgi:Ca-activated chloride channel family protein